MSETMLRKGLVWDWLQSKRSESMRYYCVLTLELTHGRLAIHVIPFVPEPRR